MLRASTTHAPNSPQEAEITTETPENTTKLHYGEQQRVDTQNMPFEEKAVAFNLASLNCSCERNEGHYSALPRLLSASLLKPQLRQPISLELLAAVSCAFVEETNK